MLDHTVALLSLSLALVGATAHAQETAHFLKVGYGARAAAMGNSYTALADDSDALYWNPGAMSLTGRPEVGMTRARMFLGDTYDAVSAAIPLGTSSHERRESLGYRRTAVAVYQEAASRGVLAIGYTRLGHVAQEGRGLERNQTGTFRAADTAVSIGYSRALLRGFHAGLSLKRISSRIGEYSAGTTAADLGVVHRFRGRRHWRLAAAVRNLGPGLRFDSQTSPLPLNIAVGSALEAMPGLLFSTELQVRPNADKIIWSIGTEYALMPMLSLRTGFKQDQFSGRGKGGSGLGDVGGGFGLKWGRFDLDYSITPSGILGSVSRFSMRARF